MGRYRSGGGRGRRAGEGHDFLDGEAQLEAVQRVADSDFSLDLRVRQCRHDGPALHVGSARRYVPSRHAHPQLATGGGKETGQVSKLEIQLV